MNRKEIDIITKATLLRDLLEFFSIFQKQSEELGHLYILRLKHTKANEDDWSGKINATNSLIKKQGLSIIEDL